MTNTDITAHMAQIITAARLVKAELDNRIDHWQRDDPLYEAAAGVGGLVSVARRVQRQVHAAIGGES